jgi:hypothetical protein
VSKGDKKAKVAKYTEEDIKAAIREAGDRALWNYWCADGWNEKMYGEMARNVMKKLEG